MADATKLKIIDVSKHQGKISWNKVSGIDGVIIRAGYRGWGSAGDLVKDEQADNNFSGAISAGFKRIGAYFFSQAMTVKEAEEEADLCIKVLAPYKSKITFPVYFDSEYGNTEKTGRADKLSKATRTECAKAFCAKIKAAGYTPGIYASLSWFNDSLYAGQLTQYTWWVAAYRSTRPDIASEAWQFTSSATITGLSGKIDCSYWYRDFYTGGSWKKDSQGRWTYGDLKNCWQEIKSAKDGKTRKYYFNSQGFAVTGWQSINGKFYRFATKEESDKYGFTECALIVEYTK